MTESKTYPEPAWSKREGKVFFPYNIQQVEKQTEDGTETIYEYDLLKVPFKGNIETPEFETAKQQVLDQKTAKEKFRDSPFNDVSTADADNYINANVTDLASAKDAMKKMIHFTIGLREVLREVLKDVD